MEDSEELTMPSSAWKGNAHPSTMYRSGEEMARLLALVLDQLDYPLLLVESHRVMHRNRAASKSLAQSDCVLRIEQGLLLGTDAYCSSRLQRALDFACEQGRQQMVTLPRAGELQSGNAPTSSVAIVPLAAGPAGAGTALVVLARTQLCSLLTAHWFCSANRLTQAESSVLRDLVDGLDANAIAQRNRVALSTVRTQIAQVRDKTQARGIRELLALVAKLPPLAAAI